MTFDALMLLLAAGGGFLGAAIGGLNAFIFTGLAVLLGNAILMAGGSAGFLNTVAFGPFLGPHVAFVGGVAAVAYAGRKAARVAERAADLAVAPAAVAAMSGAGTADLDRPRDVSVVDLENAGPAPDDAPIVGGKDIGVPLISLEQWDVLLVGVVAGMLGYCVNQVVAAIGWFGTHTDTIAFTVIVMAIATRLLFGRTGLFPKSGSRPDGASGWGRFAPYDEARWIKYHERFVPATMLGAFVGLFDGVVVHCVPGPWCDSQDVCLRFVGPVADLPGPGSVVPGDSPHHVARWGGRRGLPADRARQPHRGHSHRCPRRDPGCVAG